MTTSKLNAQRAVLSPQLFREVIARLPNNLERIEMHPWQLQAYEESGSARVTLNLADGQIPGFDGVPFADPITIDGVAVRSSTKLPKDIVQFFANGELVGEIIDVGLPVFE